MSAQSAVCPHCETKLKVPSAVAGKKIRCPKCKEAFAVPTEDEEAIDAPPKAVALPARVVKKWDDDEDAESKDADEPHLRGARRRRHGDNEERPGRKKHKHVRANPLLLWGLVGGGAAVVLAGVVIGAVQIMNGTKGSSSASSPGATIEIKAEELTLDMVSHLQNPEGFRKKYSGGTLLVAGTVFGSGQEGQGEFRVFLVGHKNPGGAMVTAVTCIFTGNDIADAKKHKDGSTVRITCKLSRLTSNADGVVVEECRIMSPR